MHIKLDTTAYFVTEPEQVTASLKGMASQQWKATTWTSGGQGDHFDQELDPPSAQHHATWTMTFMPYAKLVLHM